MEKEFVSFCERLRVKCLPHFSSSEFLALIDRVEKTVHLEEGSAASALKDVKDTQVVQEQKCRLCPNRDAEFFYFDSKVGDTICMGVNGRWDYDLTCGGCGSILQDHRMEEGAAHRNFEGEDDRNHYGPAPNRLMPESVNYRTSLGALQGKETAEMKRLSETHAALEMNYSKIGNDERRTREGYKADQKKQAFLDMEQLGDSLRIHPQVVKKAQEEFASYRDKKEAVQQYDGVVAACLALAFREIGRAGGNVLKAKPGLIVRKPTEVAATRTISDTAIAIHTDCPMKSWDLKKVKDWLLGVAGGEYAAEAEQLFHLVKEADCKATTSIEDKSKGQRYPSTSKVSFLGTTTVAGRKKKLMERTLTEVIKPTAGQHLLRLYLGRIRFASERDGEDDAKHPLKDAIRRRLDFDKQRDAAEGSNRAIQPLGIEILTSIPSDYAIKLEKDNGFSSAAIGGGVGTLNKAHPSSADINVSQNSASPTGSITPSEGRLSPIEDSTTLVRKKARFVIK